MLESGKTWFLLADGRRARVLAEARRGAALVPEWEMEIGEDDLYDAQDRPPRSFDRVGAGRHAMDKGRSLHQQEEENFLKRLADRVSNAGARGLFDHLVVAAPPRALGSLRDKLSTVAQSRIRAETAKDLVSAPAPELRERLRDLLRH